MRGVSLLFREEREDGYLVKIIGGTSLAFIKYLKISVGIHHGLYGEDVCPFGDDLSYTGAGYKDNLWCFSGSTLQDLSIEEMVEILDDGVSKLKELEKNIKCCDLDYFQESPKDFQKALIKHEPELIGELEIKDHDLLEVGLGRRGACLQFVEDQTPELCEIAVINDPKAIRFVDKRLRTPHLISRVLMDDYSCIMYLDDVTDDLVREYLSTISWDNIKGLLPDRLPSEFQKYDEVLEEAMDYIVDWLDVPIIRETVHKAYFSKEPVISALSRLGGRLSYKYFEVYPSNDIKLSDVVII